MTKIGTLKELGVKPGDVVVLHGDKTEEKFICVECPQRTKGYPFDDHWDFGNALFRDGEFRIISRAAETPKLWCDMTPEEKGALLLAHHEGKNLQFTRPSICNEWRDVAVHPEWCQGNAYRVKPEPKVETVDIIHAYDITGELYSDTHRITFNLIDGKPDCASVKMEPIK